MSLLLPIRYGLKQQAAMTAAQTRPPTTSLAAAARAAGVSESLIGQANVVLTWAPHLAAFVASGAESLERAYALAQAVRDEQQAAPPPPPPTMLATCAGCGAQVARLDSHWTTNHPVDPNYVPPPASAWHRRRGRPPREPIHREVDFDMDAVLASGRSRA